MLDSFLENASDPLEHFIEYQVGVFLPSLGSLYASLAWQSFLDVYIPWTLHFVFRSGKCFCRGGGCYL